VCNTGAKSPNDEKYVEGEEGRRFERNGERFVEFNRNPRWNANLSKAIELAGQIWMKVNDNILNLRPPSF
jgi:hypothetical protein